MFCVCIYIKFCLMSLLSQVLGDYQLTKYRIDMYRRRGLKHARNSACLGRSQCPAESTCIAAKGRSTPGHRRHSRDSAGGAGTPSHTRTPSHARTPPAQPGLCRDSAGKAVTPSHAGTPPAQLAHRRHSQHTAGTAGSPPPWPGHRRTLGHHQNSRDTIGITGTPPARLGHHRHGRATAGTAGTPSG